MKKHKWTGYLLGAVFAVLFAFLAEFILFHQTPREYAAEKVTKLHDNEAVSITYQVQNGRRKLSAQQENAILIERENGKILAQLNGSEYVPPADDSLEETAEGMYRKVKRTVFTVTAREPIAIRSLRICCPETAEGTDVWIEAEEDGELSMLVNTYMDERLHEGSYRVDRTLQHFRITLSNVDEIDGAAVQFLVENSVPWNPARLLFFFAAALLTAFFAGNRDWFARRPERAFALIAVLLGSVLIYASGTNQAGYDEHIHFASAYNRSFLTRVETTESVMQAEAGTFPEFTSLAERRLVEAYADQNHDYSWANITYQSRFPAYDTRSYLPLSAGLWIGRQLSLPFAWCVMLAEWMNLLCYTVLTAFAIRLAKQGKVLIAALGLLPNMLFAACVFTYDSVVNAFLLLAVVLTTNLVLERGTKITWLHTLLILGCFVAGSTAKPVYIVMALLLVFLSGNRFSSRLREWLFKTSVIAVCGLMIYTIFFPPVSASSNYELIGNLAYAGDKRTQGTSVLGQLSYLLDNPFAYAGLLLRSMAGELLDYLSGRKLFLDYGYLGELPAVWTWLGALALTGAAVCAPQGEARQPLGARFRSLYLIMILGVSAVVWTSMYVSFTAVGAAGIEGVQGRYFLPLFLPFFYCLMNGRHTVKIPPGLYAKILLGVFTAMNLFAIYALAVANCM